MTPHAIARYLLRSLGVNVKNLHGSLAIVLSALTFLLISCGKENEPAPPAPPRGTLIANLFVARDLASRGLSQDGNCFQLVEDASDKQRGLEVNAGACPAEGINPTFLKRLEIQEFIDTEDLTAPTNRFILYDRFMPVGEVEKRGDRYVLREICTGDFYRVSCELRMNQAGIVLALVPSKNAPTDRMLQEAKRTKENTELVSRVKELKTQIERAKALVDAPNKAMLEILTAQSLRVDPMIENLQKDLDGDGKTDGKLIQYANASKDLLVLTAKLSAMAQSFKGQEDDYALAQKEAEAAVAALQTANNDREKAAAEMAKAAAGEELARATEKVKDALAEVGRKYALVVAAGENISNRLQALNESKAKAGEAALRGVVAQKKDEVVKLQTQVLMEKEILADLKVVKKAIDVTAKLIEMGKSEEAVKILPVIVSRLDYTLSRITVKTKKSS